MSRKRKERLPCKRQVFVLLHCKRCTLWIFPALAVQLGNHIAHRVIHALVGAAGHTSAHDIEENGIGHFDTLTPLGDIFDTLPFFLQKSGQIAFDLL